MFLKPEVTPAIQPLLQGFTDLAAAGAGSLGGIAPMLTSIGKAMSNFANSGGVNQWLTAAATAAQQLWTAIKPLGSAIKAMAGPLGTVGAAVRGVMTPAFQAAATAVKALAPVFQQLANLIGPVLGAVVPPIAKAFAGLAKAVGAALGPALKAAAPIIRQIAQQLGPVLSQAVAKLVPQLIQLGKQIGGFLVQAFKMLAPVISFLLPIVVDTFKGIVKAIQGAIQFLTGIFKMLSGLLQGDWGKMWAGLKQAALGAVTALWNIFKAWILGKVMKVFKLFGGLLRGLWNKIWSAVSGTVSKWIGQIVAWVVRMKDRTLGVVSDAGSWLVKAGKNVVQGLIDGIKSMIGGVGRAMSGVAGKIRDYLPFSPAKEGPLSGGGNPEASGRKIGRMLADGIGAQRSLVGSAMGQLTRNAIPAPALPGAAFAPTPMPKSAAAPMPLGATGLVPGRGRQQTTTYNAPQQQVTNHNSFHVTSPTENPERVARRTANRIAQLSTA